MDWDNFFKVHNGLPRQGPGTPDDVAWAVGLAGLPAKARICDAACGTGGDIKALLDAAPEAHVTAIEIHPDFVTFTATRFAGTPRLSVEAGDMAALPGPFDMIWCAGALYFLGLEDGLETMKSALHPSGILAFSEPAFFTDAPSAEAVEFWDGYPTRRDIDVANAVRAAGYDLLGQRTISDAGWHAYFAPMQAKIDALRPDADAALTDVLDMCATEAAKWHKLRAETGYTLIVARAA